MIKSAKNIITISSLAILLNACGGGSGGSESSISSSVNAQDNSKYAWHLNPNIDSSYKTTHTINDDAHINPTAAWTKTKGTGIKVAVIDQDFDVTHPDLNGKIFATFNAMNNSTVVSGTNEADDNSSHGTAVAGMIASPSLGSAPDVELILININLGENSGLTVDNILTAFDKAEELGAKVINCSWGGGGVDFRVINKLNDLKSKGITVVFASGNGFKLTENSPEIYDLDTVGYLDESELNSVIGVGATNIKNDVTSYSNYGSNIDVIAPGGDNSLGVMSLDLSGNDGLNNATAYANNNYVFTIGTSFASPTVTGVVALMLGVNPNLTPDDVRRILIQTTDKVGSGNGANYQTQTYDGVTGTFDQKRAFGKIDASAAVQQAENEL